MTMLEFQVKSIPYTYILEWTKMGKRYIGARWAKGCTPSDLWNSYFTSSKYVADFVLIHGKPDIILIDQIFNTAEETMKREQFLQKKFNIKNNDAFLNKAIAGFGIKITQEHKDKIGFASKHRIRSKETHEKVSKSLTGKKLSSNHVEKIRLLKTGNTYRRGAVLSSESKEKMRIAKLGKKASQETKDKMSKTRLGKKYEIVECPHCHKTGGVSRMKSWHFNNCRNT